MENFLLRHLQKLVVIGGIGRFWENAEDVCAGVFLNDISHILRVAKPLTVYLHIAVMQVCRELDMTYQTLNSTATRGLFPMSSGTGTIAVCLTKRT